MRRDGFDAIQAWARKSRNLLVCTSFVPYLEV
jgi:hypothetical protein